MAEKEPWHSGEPAATVGALGSAGGIEKKESKGAFHLPCLCQPGLTAVPLAGFLLPADQA